MEQKPQRLSPIAVTLIVLALLFSGYVAAYFGTVTICIPPLPGDGPWSLGPHYSVGGRAAEVFFYPIHALDRRNRRDYWQLTEDEIWPALRSTNLRKPYEKHD